MDHSPLQTYGYFKRINSVRISKSIERVKPIAYVLRIQRILFIW